ncbi:unnamed protein product [Meloidogyne enterolobii]|uniref:Uncharacterized protein n=1 Tax=Meloidogyne enterolobii TaxID=390850 RepID=A0ACB0ZX91_MELEN
MESCALCSKQINSEGNISAACGHKVHLACLLSMESCPLCSKQINSEGNISAACGHNFHLACLVPYFLTKSLCPSDGCGLEIVREITTESESGFICFI